MSAPAIRPSAMRSPDSVADQRCHHERACGHGPHAKSCPALSRPHHDDEKREGPEADPRRNVKNGHRDKIYMRLMVNSREATHAA